MINAIEYGEEVLINKCDYNEEDRIYLNSIKSKYRFELRESSEGLYFKPFNYVGSIQLSSKRINIFPRFDNNFKSLIPMILFTKDIKFKYFKKDMNTSFSSDDLVEVVIELFLNEVDELMKRNLVKNYVNKSENLKVMRGRVNFNNHINKNYLRGESIYCDYEELSSDVIENQVILETLNICLKKSSNNKKRIIRKLKSELQNYCRPYRSKKFPIISYNRLNSHYKEVHYYCEIIMNSMGIENFYEDGLFKGKYSILIDMNELFESFVAKLCEKYLSDEYEVYPQYRIRNGILDTNNKTYRVMIPDIVLFNKKINEYTIIDTKNKNYGNKNVSNDDIYQLNFYGMYFSNVYENKVNVKIVYPRYEKNNSSKEEIILRGINKDRDDIRISVVGIDINECIKYINKSYQII